METEPNLHARAEVGKPALQFKERIFQITEIFKAKDVQVPQHDPRQGSVITKTISTDEGSIGTPGTPSSISPSLASSGFTDTSDHQGLQIDSNCYMLPTMPVPGEHLQSWESEVRVRLEDELAQSLRIERCHLEFSMIRYKGRIGPCIMVVCWDDSICTNEKGREIMRKKLQKKMRKLQSLRHCRFPCKVVVDKFNLLGLTSSSPTRDDWSQEMRSASRTEFSEHIALLERKEMERLAGSMSKPSGASAVSLDVEISQAQITLVSSKIQNAVELNQACTLSGLIVVGKTLYGLTVAHPFARDEVDGHGPAFATLASEEDASEESDSDESLFNELNSDRMSMFVGNPESAKSKMSLETGSTVTTDDLESSVTRQASNSSSFSPLGTIFMSSFSSRPFKNTGESEMECDWALIAMSPQCIRYRNSYVRPATSEAIEIQGILQEKPKPGLKVLVLGGRSGIQEGRVGQNNIHLRLKGRDFLATQVMLTKILEPGDSGSWVVVKDKVVGCIVGGRQMLPTAYMVAITSILDDISSTLNESDVEIWNNNPFGLLNTERAAASKVSNSAVSILPGPRLTLAEQSSESGLQKTDVWRLSKPLVSFVEDSGVQAKIHSLLPQKEAKSVLEESRKRAVEEHGSDPNRNPTFLEMTEKNSAIEELEPASSTNRKPADPLPGRLGIAGEAPISDRGSKLEGHGIQGCRSQGAISSSNSHPKHTSASQAVSAISRIASRRLWPCDPLPLATPGEMVASGDASDRGRVAAYSTESFAHAEQDLYSSLTGGAHVVGLRSCSWQWYLEYLQERNTQVWADIICPVLPKEAAADAVPSGTAAILLLGIMATVADIIRNEGKISIFEIASRLEERGMIKQDARSLAVQMVFQMVGWMTALWDPAPELSAEYLSLRQQQHHGSRRVVHKPVIRTLLVESQNADLPLHELLARFGTLMPMPETVLRHDIRGGIESGPECVNVAYISINSLQRIAGIKIEWTSTLAQHLEFDITHRLLRVFSHPSICLLLYRHQRGTAISNLFQAQREADYGKRLERSKCGPDNLEIEDFLVETILSYRLVFGHDRRSRAIMGRKGMRPSGPLDPLLEILCTKDASFPSIKHLYAELESREFQDDVSLDEFPFLAGRLMDLQRAVMRYEPRGLTKLFCDRRNINTWFIVWAVIIIGSGTLILQILQLGFQIYQPFRVVKNQIPSQQV